MNFNVKEQNNSKMEKGEELLGNSYSVNKISGKKKILVGLDCGSTQTRVVLMNQTDDVDVLDKVYVIPSLFSGVSSFSEVIPQSTRLYDNLDSWITTISNESDSLFDKIRVLRGTKRSDANLSQEGINSSKQKINTPAFYLNAIDGIAYGLIMSGEPLADEYDVYAGITLPPDNVTSSSNRDVFYKRMKQTFEFENKDLGVRFRINIKDVALQTEPEAVLRGYKVKNDVDSDTVALMVEVGGSTVGTAIIQGTVSLKAASRTFPYGGTQLQDLLGTILENSIGTVPVKQRKKALETGLVKATGRGVTDVSDSVIEAKNQFARRIYSNLFSEVFDQLGNSDLDLVDITEVYFSGRSCAAGDYNDETHDGYSLATPLTELLKKDLPDAEFIHLTENLIPFGNAVRALTTLGESFLSEEVIEESSEDEGDLRIDIEPRNIKEDEPINND